MDQRQLQIVLKLQDQASQELRKITGNLGGVEGGAMRAGNSFLTMAKRIGAVAGAYLSFRSVYDGLSLGIRVAADLQTAEVGLTTLLGSAEKASATVERLKKEAARTPFELPGLAQATQLLTSVTKDGDRSIDILLDVGEALAAMGKGQAELDRIIVNLQQVAATGRAATIDIRQFAFAGIPIYEMLSEATGKYGEDLEELISSGGVTFDLLVDMFDKANDEGGRFFNAFVNQSGTFNQALSNMKDSLGIFFSDFVKNTGLFDGLTNAMVQASNFLGNWQANLQSAKDRLNDLLDTIDQKTGLVTMFKDAIANIAFWFEERLKPAVMELWEALKPLEPFFIAMGQILGVTLVVALGAVITLVQGLTVGFIELLTWATKLGTFISKYFTWYINSLADAINDVIAFVDKLISKFERAIELAKKVGGGVSGAVKGAVNAVIPGRASGGPVMGGSPYIVGERGPELFVPRTSGNIVPSLAGVGGVTVIVNGDVTGRELVEKVSQAIADNIKRRQRFT